MPQTILLASLVEPIVSGFFVIMILAAIVAVILVHHAMTAKSDQSFKDITPTQPVEVEEDLERKLNNLPIPNQYKKQAAETVSKIFQEQLQKEIEAKSKEIAKTYESLVEQKTEQTKMVQKQYDTINKKFESLSKDFKEMGQAKKQTEEIVRSMAEGVIMVDDKGDVMLMNPAAEKMLGVKKEDRVGKSIMKDLKEEQLVTFAQDIAGKGEKEIVLQSKSDQTQKVLKASNAVIETESGKTIGFVSVLSDVTKQKEVDSIKTAFVANVSHELRTPLNNVRETLSLLRDKVVGTLNPEQEKIVTVGINNISRLSRLINDLLDLSKLEAKQTSLKLKSFVVQDLINTLLESFKAWANTREIKMSIKAPSEPIEINADEDKINQVLTNLAGNAVKFTPKGGHVIIDVIKKPNPDPSGPELIEIGVQDTGPGIAKKDFDKIFDKFVSLETAKLQGISGTGLGLALAKEIVDLHNGRIWVESEEEKGSRFAFELPLRRQEP